MNLSADIRSLHLCLRHKQCTTQTVVSVSVMYGTAADVYTVFIYVIF